MRKAFTLPELLIAVTLSAILMTGMLIFLSSGITNAWKLKKTASASVTSSLIEDRFGEMASMGSARVVHSGSYTDFGSGILLFQSGSHLPLSFLATKSFTGYCNSNTGAINADGKISRLFFGQTETPYFSGVSGNFSLSGNLVMSGTEILVGKYQNTSEDDVIPSAGANPGEVSLLHPRAILETTDGLLVADTGKNRILAYTGSKVYPLLPENLGLLHPSILKQNASTLEIRGETNMMTLWESPICSSGISPNFSVNIPALSFDRVVLHASGITFPSATGAYLFGSDSPSSTGSITDGIELSFTPSVSSSTATITWLQIPNPLPGSYFISLEFSSGGTSPTTLRFPLITCGDTSLLSMSGNIVTSTSSPWFSDANGASYNFSAFSGNLVWSESALSPYPISDFTWTADANILTISYLEYIHYDCALENHERRERILKIPLQ